MPNFISARLFVFILIIFFSPFLCGDFAIAESTVVSQVPMNLDSMTYNKLCGQTTTEPRHRICLGDDTDDISANDSVSHLKYFVTGYGHSCGVDERGVRCWKTTGRFAKPIQEILAAGDSQHAQFNRSVVCVPQKNLTIRCDALERDVRVAANPTKGQNGSTVRRIPPPQIFGPFLKLQDFAMNDETICFLNDGAVTCDRLKAVPDTGVKQPMAPSLTFSGAKSLTVTWDSICVLAKDGLSCFRGRRGEEVKTYRAAGAWTTATRLFRNGANTVCAVGSDHAPLCARMSVDDESLGEINFPELHGLEVLDFKASGDNRCVRVNTPSNRSALYCGAFQSMSLVPIATEDITDFSVTDEGICALNKSGIVSCFYGTLHLDSPLPEDGSVPKSAGHCRWNKTRFHCSLVDFAADTANVSNVIGASIDASDVTNLPCVIYENSSGVRDLKCFGMASTFSDSAPEVDADMTSIAVMNHFGCIYGGATTKCWGEPYADETVPNLRFAKKILLGTNYGCALDDFGLICWGEKLDERGLGVPKELSDRSAVLDFAIGQNHACAITRDRVVQCWGLNAAALDVPHLTNASSVLISNEATCASSDEGVTCWGPRGDVLTTTGVGLP